MSRPPRKYLDADRIKVNPEWITWRDEQLAEAREALPNLMTSRGMDPAVYFPEAYDKAIDEDGDWLLILEEPFTELRERFRVPLLSMWRARPHVLNEGRVSLNVRDRSVHVSPHQAVIATPGGDLHLWPHEYHVVDDPYGLITCEGAELHSLGGEPILDEEELFYLQSRGIGYPQAVLLLVDRIKATNWGYVTFPEEVTEQLRGVGQPLWRHIQQHPRTREAS